MDVKRQTWVIVQSTKETGKDALAVFRKGLDHLLKAMSKGHRGTMIFVFEGLC